MLCLSRPDEELPQTELVFGLIRKPFIRDCSNPWGTAENRSAFLVVSLIIYFFVGLNYFWCSSATVFLISAHTQNYPVTSYLSLYCSADIQIHTTLPSPSF